MKLRGPIVVLVCGLAVAFAAHQRARASCSAPTKCRIAQVEVRSCKVFEAEKDPQISRYAAELRKEKQGEREKALFDAYRGVIVEVHETSEKLIACKTSTPPKSAYDEAAFPLDSGGLSPTDEQKAGIHHYFAPTRDPKACDKRFAEKRTLRMYSAMSCCDGDPNPPCYITR